MTNANATPAVLKAETIKLPPPASPAVEPDKASCPQWSSATRIAFRFCFSFFLLLVVPSPDGAIVSWVGRHVLHLGAVPQRPFTGSGDTTFAYVEAFCTLLAAGLVTLLWSALDRKRTQYARLYQWLRLGVRLLLGTAMLSYGGMKLIPAQMPAPGLSTLLESFGDAGPMRLLWTFMGASSAYQSFGGAAEMLGGILLFIPGVTTLGALICVAVLTNVFMLNMCYDVPVKLFSFQLLLMAVFLVAPDLRRLADVFVFHRPTALAQGPALFRRRWLNRGVAALLLLIGVGSAAWSLREAYQARQSWAAEPRYYGAWAVQEYAVDGMRQPADQGHATRWKRFIVDLGGRLTVQYMDAPQDKFMAKFDDSRKAFDLTKPGDVNWKTELAVHDQGSDGIVLEGQVDGQHILARLQLEPARTFILTSRGFHWVNEYPFNR